MGHLGIDISQPGVPWDRLPAYEFVVLSAYYPSGEVNPVFVDHATTARSQPGSPAVQLYHYPSGDDPASQVASVVAAVDQAGLPRSTMYWLDIEDGSPWADDPGQNVATLLALVGAVVGAGMRNVGIYAHGSTFVRLMGDTVAFAGLPLWWSDTARPGTQPGTARAGFDGWQPFGGWKQPAMRQYRIDVPIVGAEPPYSVDLNWYP
jgi:hypothetical protein